MSLLLSTAWNAFRHTNAKKLIFEIKKTGFQEVELSFNLTSSMVRDIAGLVKNKEIRVISLHNFCPIPDGIKRCAALPDYYSMSLCADWILYRYWTLILSFPALL